MYQIDEIRKIDPEVAESIENEVNRQRNKIELIASENFVDGAVMQALGTPLTNKYAEGYREKGITEAVNVDVIEQLAIDRAKRLGRACQCPAAFRRTGKLSGVLCRT